MKIFFTILAMITCTVFIFAYLFFKDRILWEAVAALITLAVYAVSPCVLLLDRNGVPRMDTVE
ncbi:hypothetical protein [Succinivibrio dextrinosolvens]|uniref:hypothetical protein n=1 Tax=Succinivibrio dextrinosolvens TaxID=83771 RepID=UPI00241E0D7F|nr:hypothetical protein [Succinivibrio dextrinosolvens]MBE6422447.1 hypothetical protein [Succinivibrio dextrinosolvens]